MNTEMRRAVAADREAIAQLIYRRSAWMYKRGLQGWEQHANHIANQAGTRTQLWVLCDEDRRSIVGMTQVDTQCPEWLWTDVERSEPSYFLSNTVTDPRYAGMRLGCRIAYWALDRAAYTGHLWVRRGTTSRNLVRYYSDVQGWHVVRSLPRRGEMVTALTRRAERIYA